MTVLARVGAGLAAAAALATLSGAAHADEYDHALRCMSLIELAKSDYTAANVDQLRDASDAWVLVSNAVRPEGLSDQDLLMRYLAVVNVINDELGLKSAVNRAEAIACAGEVHVELVLPE